MIAQNRYSHQPKWMPEMNALNDSLERYLNQGDGLSDELKTDERTKRLSPSEKAELLSKIGPEKAKSAG